MRTRMIFNIRQISSIWHVKDRLLIASYAYFTNEIFPGAIFIFLFTFFCIYLLSFSNLVLQLNVLSVLQYIWLWVLFFNYLFGFIILSTIREFIIMLKDRIKAFKLALRIKKNLRIPLVYILIFHGR